jgi:hypothetical protein
VRLEAGLVDAKVTSATVAMAIPPSDIKLNESPMRWNGTATASTVRGMVRMGIAALGGCHRNTRITSTTVRMIRSVRVESPVDKQFGGRAERDQLTGRGDGRRPPDAVNPFTGGGDGRRAVRLAAGRGGNQICSLGRHWRTRQSS